MRNRVTRTDEPVRTRVLFNALIGVLSIGGALILRESTIASQRAGALLLLVSGLLFATVVIVDWARGFLNRSDGARANANTALPHHLPGARPTATRRIRPPRPEMQTAEGAKD